MHRVYNSAFMHMLRDEDNAGYRRVMRETLEFDPGVLGRFVNFLTKPDEKPAAEQLGTGDRAFSAATLLATLPGLPMLGHGQVEGWRERYGHEFRRARWDEPIDEGHAGHFEWAIVPLLRRRAAFSGTDRFHLYDAVTDGGAVDENVYAFTNGSGDDRNLVLVHHRQGDTTIRIDQSVAAAPVGGGPTRSSVRLADALQLDGPDDAVIRLVDHRSGYEIRTTNGDLRRDGLRVPLGAYEARVLWLVTGEPPSDTPPPTPATQAPTPAPVRPTRRCTGGAKRAARPTGRSSRSRAGSTAKPARRKPPAKGA